MLDNSRTLLLSVISGSGPRAGDMGQPFDPLHFGPTLFTGTDVCLCFSVYRGVTFASLITCCPQVLDSVQDELMEPLCCC